MLPEMANRESLDCFALLCCRDFLFTGFAVETAAFSSGPVSTQLQGICLWLQDCEEKTGTLN